MDVKIIALEMKALITKINMMSNFRLVTAQEKNCDLQNITVENIKRRYKSERIHITLQNKKV